MNCETENFGRKAFEETSQSIEKSYIQNSQRRSHGESCLKVASPKNRIGGFLVGTRPFSVFVDPWAPSSFLLYYGFWGKKPYEPRRSLSDESYLVKAYLICKFRSFRHGTKRASWYERAKAKLLRHAEANGINHRNLRGMRLELPPPRRFKVVFFPFVSTLSHILVKTFSSSCPR